jgi:hypothetical protein
MSSCGHSHGPGETCDHQSVVGFDPGNSLLGEIDIDKVRCLNESRTGSLKDVLLKKDNSTVISEEDEDPELLMFIPFFSPVQIRAIKVSSSLNPPRKVKLITNRDQLDFHDAQRIPGQQELDLAIDGQDLEYPLKSHKFLNVSILILFFTGGASSSSQIQLDSLEIFGISSKLKREAVITVYESKPMLSDHSTKNSSSTISSNLNF